MGYKTLEDWYNIEKIDITSTGGTHLLTGHYNTSPVRMLMQIYPTHPWQPWKFKFIANPLENLGNQQVLKVNQDRFVNHLETELKIKDLKDWYQVPQRQLQETGGATIIKKMGGIQDFLTKVYPNHTWDKELLEATRKRSSQRWLRVLIQEFLPNSEVKEDYQHPDLMYEPSKEHIQFDIYLPKEQVAIEYQGQHHYTEVSYFGAQKFIRDRDEAKRKKCAAAGVKLIEIPHWWDNERASLRATLHKHHPFLFPDAGDGTPIPDKAPQRVTPTGDIPAADVFTLPKSDWDPETDPTGWWMSEGFEGLRVYWDGEKLHTRKGNELKTASQSFLDILPKEPLDGFLRGPSYETRDAINMAKSSNPEKWRQMTFYILDSPKRKEPLEQRQAHLKSLVLNPQVKLMEFVRCTGESDMLQFYTKIMDKGGEGVFLRQPNSAYQHGRSKTFYTLKAYEETVAKYLGKNEAAHKLVCELPNGVKCNVACASQTYDHPPKEGAVLQIRHSGEYSTGNVRYPCFLKERTDTTWEVAKTSALQAIEKAKQDKQAKEDRYKSIDLDQ
eukprot:Phypoly_transcript_05025.p1 GENE.Phypoly_transcript_05025~~Phypoly_transcript_05025.p1  ORF type:complete len:652 (+),score=87.56 Phypoly_transcript_05025:291-1958(+)